VEENTARQLLQRLGVMDVDDPATGNIATDFSWLSVLKYAQDRGEKFKNKLRRGR